jgi:hypothetical protein
VVRTEFRVWTVKATAPHLDSNTSTAAQRRHICERCDCFRGDAADVLPDDEKRVTRCRLGPIGGVNLATGRCPLDKWPTTNSDGESKLTRPLGTRPAATASSARHPDLARFIDDDQRALLAARRAICDPCDLQRGFTVLTVKCKHCGCAGLSLLHGRCPLRKWDNDGNGSGDHHDGGNGLPRTTPGPVTPESRLEGRAATTTVQTPLPPTP